MQTKRLLNFLILLLGIGIAHGQTNLSTLALSAGQRHGLALRSDGSVWTWGTNQFGELGLGTNKLVMWPTRISSITNIISISAGSLHSLAVQSNGTVWAWGTNVDGRLGNGTFVTSSNPVIVTRITNAVMVSAGGNHSLALLANGSVMAWGANLGGQLGTGNTVSTNQPVPAGSFTNAIFVAAGTNFSLALTQDGSVWSWGTNNMGQLGLGTTTSQLSPAKITTLSNIVQIAAGSSHSLAMDRNGVVYAWGRNTEGQIGNGTTVNATAPVIVPSFGSTTNLGAVKWIAAGYNSSAAILKGGRMFYWGWYGNGTFWSSNQPPQELNANSGLVFNSATYGDSYLLAQMPDGSTWAWGFNQYSQWGNGNLYATNDNWSYQLCNAQFTFSANPYPVATRFTRGDRNDLNYLPMLPYNSFVLPLDLEQGVALNNTGDDAYGYGASQPWFLNVQKTERGHAWQLTAGTTNLTRFTVDNPIVAFGNSAGGSPLYVNQPYRFGLFGGAYLNNTGQTNMIRVLVYNRSAFVSGATNVTPTNIFYIALPRQNYATDAASWANYVTNGNQVVVVSNGLTTAVSYNYGPDDFSSWGLGWIYTAGNYTDATITGFRLTHEASSTNYCYVIEALGSCEVGANVFSPMAVTNGTTSWAYLPIYALGFDAFPAWRAHFIDNPNFEGTLVPPTYSGTTNGEPTALSTVITNSIWITNNPAYTNLDDSPELRRSPILDQFVADMHGNPMALANYVINDIALTDPVAYGETANAVANSIEVGGVNRSALGTYLEGQGSPVEQCALLVYLLRQAGYPATYVWPTNSNLQLLSSTVSRIWQINVNGVVWNSGIPLITNSLIVANYPWVVANIGTNSVQIFPWLKNTANTAGLNIYNYMPTNYPTAYSWVKDFCLANPSLMALASPNDSLMTFWQNYLTSLINSNSIQPNLSLQDFGVWSVNRPNTYTSWSQFPLPDALYNQSQVAVIQTLSDSPVTYPFLTNMFDQVQIQVYKNSTNSGNLLFNTGLWDACDLQNRKLLLYTNTPTSVSLWLSAYRTGVTNTSNFTNYLSGTNAVLIQIASAPITSSVTNLPVVITYQKRIGSLVNPNIWFVSLAYYGGAFAPFNCSPGDVSAIIPSVSSVSSSMLGVWAQDYWNLEQKRATNTSYVPAITDEAGDAAMILDSSFFQKLWSDNQLNQNLHGVRGLTWDSYGVASVTQLPSYKMQVKLSEHWFATFVFGNAMADQNSGDTGSTSLNNFLTMMQANGSSAEYSTIASVWQDQSPVSAIRLLQIAAQNWRSNSTAAPPELNIENYTTLGNQTFAGYGSTALKNQIPAVWSQVTNVFTTEEDSNFVRLLITPGPVTNSTGSFKGMSALFFGETETGDIISDNETALNGGYSDFLDSIDEDDDDSTYDLTYNLDYSPSSDSYTFVETSYTIAVPTPQYTFSSYDVLNLTANSGNPPQVAFTPEQVTQASLIAAGLNLPSSSTADAIKSESDVGWFGNAWARVKQAGTVVADPVQVVSGDFCADSVDVALAGPMPLPLHRNYQSRNLATDEVGAGWKFGITPWLVITTNAAGNVIANAAEMDGSVIAYRQQTNNLWTVMPADNPDLVNFTPNGIGGTANVFNNQIQQNPTNSQIYTLTASDGSTRTFQVMTNFGISDGTNYLNRIRPYLTLWQDHAGNYYQFTYGTNSANNNYGQLYQIQGANGASLTFEYDYYGRVTQVLTDDGRIVSYQYDTYGDLVGVTLPDNTTWQYGYEHYTFTTNSQTYTDSYHLLTTETKPDGRQLVNGYDSLRRVISQQATVGINRELITNATFFYTNNCTGLTNSLISGETCVQDVFGNPYYYYYTNNLVTESIEPLGRTNIQNWYSISQTNLPGYYQNSLQYAVDVRGLTNWFLYDFHGNITNQTIYGNLTGNGVGSQSATNSYVYTTNNCPAIAIDTSGDQMQFLYNDPSDAYHLTDLQFSSGGVGIATNHWLYTNVTATVNMGGWFETNSSFGLCFEQILADSATNTWTYNGRGFPVKLTQYAATADMPNDSDPPVVTYFSYTPLGDISMLTDASGRQVDMNYDAMGRLEWRNVVDQFGNTLSAETFYYDGNGELEWYEGPRSNPDDYIWFSYDGGGRKVQEIHWRTQANPNGTGIEAVPGSNLYATMFYTYDYFGNLTSTADSRGAFTTNSWDALGRLSQRKSYDVGGVTLLATEGFGYEVGGLLQSDTNALGGVTAIQYTSTGQPESRQNADGSTNGWTYYLDGRIQNEILGNGSYWQSTYNDANLTATRIFYSAAGTPLATNTMASDRRGNIVQWTDAAGNVFTNSFDGLGRVKVSSGPSILTVSEIGNTPNSGVYATNVLQQAITNFYDASGIVLTSINALGETTVTTFDALSRTTSTLIYGSNGSLVRERYFAYSSDHNSVTVTDGSGPNAVSHTIYTDSEGHIVLSVANPSAYTTEFTLNQYDVAGNLTSAQHDSSLNGNVTTWTTASYSYDGLDRLTSKVDRDNALTTYAYDQMSDLTNRTIPGNLQWQGIYNNAGQLLQEQNVGGGNLTRTTTYAYYPSGNPFAGLLQTKTDGRGTSGNYIYDNWLRLSNVVCSGSLPEQNLTTTWQYEPRGFITSMTEQFASTNTGPTTTLSRSFDPYGQLASESVNAGSFTYNAGQGWDAAGRRSFLNIGSGGYGYTWQADGNLIGASDSTGSGIYSFDTAGLLTNRLVGGRSTTITSRDGEGRPLSIATTVNLVSQLSESLSWSGDGLLSSHTLLRGDFGTDARSYSYANLSRRLVQEQLNVNASTVWTNTMAYDGGVGGGPGVLTQMGQANSSSNEWSGGADAFSRLATETNNSSQFPAYGNVNGQSILLNGWLDNQPVSITGVGTNAMQWQAMMELTPGTHQLTVSALHPSGYFTAWATNSFTNNVAFEATVDSYDSEGNITNRVWKNPSGTVERTQTLSWDALGRLHAVVQRDASNSGYNWSAVYDPLNRRLQTTTVLVSNGVASTAPPQSINSYFDPQGEFLELGASSSDQTVWKLYGPDLDGTYDGFNGAGGLDGVSPYLNEFNPTISDVRGNILAEVTNGVTSWNAARPTGYGAVPGYRPAAFANGADMAQSSAWRGHEVDITGLYNLGFRPYDPVSGRWLSADPLEYTDRDPNAYTFCGGDSVNFLDPDGLDGVTVFQAFFPATASATGVRPFSGSVGGDVQWVHGVVYPTMQLPFAPLMEPHVQGGLKVVSGAGETAAGGFGLATTSETGVGAYVSGLAVAHGADTMQSGFRQLWTGQPTPSFTQERLTYVTGSPTFGAFGDAAIGTALTFGASAYAAPRIVALHDAMQARYTWGAPPGANWRQGVGFQLRQQLGIVNSDEELHHWLIPQRQWGSWVPNYIKNQPWNIMVMNSAREHALIDPFRRVAGVSPYSMAGRLWFGTPAEFRAAAIGGGLGTGYTAFEASGGDVFMDDNSTDSGTVLVGKKPGP